MAAPRSGTRRSRGRFFDKYNPRPRDEMVLINTPDGVSDANTQTLQKVHAFPVRRRKGANARRIQGELHQSHQKILNLLLALGLIVKLVGIINTLVLTVYERMRTPRAVGMTRRHVPDDDPLREHRHCGADGRRPWGNRSWAFLAALVSHRRSPAKGSCSRSLGCSSSTRPCRDPRGDSGRSDSGARRAARLNVLKALQYSAIRSVRSLIGSARATSTTAERGGVLPPLLRLRRGDGETHPARARRPLALPGSPAEDLRRPRGSAGLARGGLAA